MYLNNVIVTNDESAQNELKKLKVVTERLSIVNEWKKRDFWRVDPVVFKYNVTHPIVTIDV